MMNKFFLIVSVVFLTINPCWAQDVRDDIVENALNVIEQTNMILSVPESEKDIVKDGWLNGDPRLDEETVETPSMPAGAEEVRKPAAVVELVSIEAVDFNNTPIQEALSIISQKSRLKIIPQEGLEGKVTLSVKNIDVFDLLKIIADAQGLVFHQEDGVARVMTEMFFEERYGHSYRKERQSLVIKLQYVDPLDVIVRLNQMKSAAGKVIPSGTPKTIILIDTFAKVEDMKSVIKRMDIALRTEVFILQYSLPKEVEEKVKPLLSAEVGQILYDERSQKIVITDTEEAIAKIAKSIAELDVRRSVVMDAEAIQVVLTEEYNEGIDWEAIVTNYYCLGQDDSSCKEGKRDLSVGTINQEDYDVLKEALDAVGEVDVIAGPTIKSVTRSRTYLKISPIDSDVIITMANPSYSSSVNNMDRIKGPGVRLFLTPTVHLDDSVSLEITTELPSAFVKDGEKQQVRTGNLNILDDSIVVIGGMFKEEEVKMTKKFPLLGDIPLVGLAFRRQRYKTVRTEHVIFLRLKPLLPEEE